MSTELLTTPTQDIIVASAEAQAFELVQRQAKMLAASTLVPKEFQGNMANCAIGLNIAKRLGADPFMVLQNIDIIHGRPSFRATFLIAMVNASGRFSPLKFREDGEGEAFGCTAYATDKASGEIVEGPKVNWEMVKAEGWYGKAGSKWKTMPQLMFRYRAAAFFARIYAPDITLGMQTAEELHDMPAEPRNVTPQTTVTLANPFAPPAGIEDAGEADSSADDLPPEPSGPVTVGFFEKFETAESKPDAKKPWKLWRVHYSIAGGPVREAVTFSATIGTEIEWLSDGDKIELELEAGEKGDTIKSIRKAEGGEA